MACACNPHTEDEGCGENFGPSLINRYVFGKGNVLITGQAAGFLNMIGEGMSCALHSGAISGEAVVEARARNRPVQEMYRRMIASGGAPHDGPVEPAQNRVRPSARSRFPGRADGPPWRDRARCCATCGASSCCTRNSTGGRQMFRRRHAAPVDRRLFDAALAVADNAGASAAVGRLRPCDESDSGVE